MSTPEPKRDLSKYRVTGYHPGRGKLVQVLWYVTNALIFNSQWFPFSALKVLLLRLFGARIGRGVNIKPLVRIKLPWRLSVGDHSWIGESVWIDNLAEVRIGSNCCISQGAYLCTGSHDHRSESFDLQVRPITIEDGAWVCAKVVVLGGAVVAAHSVISAGSCVHKTRVSPAPSE
ncbi:MAG: colanic acid biosynthesis acetyltransferase WcaF [Planctomycetaceae bacterium]|nr:colanic acid biosynthesis acetyltransferase WcaF [Planctomycetaceae bacterium]